MTRQERAERTRHKLIHSAAVVFDRHGFTRTTLNDISRLAGMSTGALHFHFANKEAVADAVECSASGALHHAALLVRQGGEGPREALQALADVSHTLAQLLHWDVVVRAGFRLNHDRLNDDRAGRPGATPDLRQEWKTCVRRLLDDAAAEKTLTPGIDICAMTATITAATTGLAVLGRGDAEWLSRESLTDLWQVLLPRLTAPEILAQLEPAGADSVIAASVAGAWDTASAGASEADRRRQPSFDGCDRNESWTKDGCMHERVPLDNSTELADRVQHSGQTHLHSQ
ncbi:ScbR family autoregulator-binding transcription factor, partial [Streptomyces sp. NPDC005407]|uniref:ScbR family autoregulator-binding transcription factor n=1 Tax=Streptomyces sp. NPDC005407 TaxID=3155340 RepID=UPI0033A6B3A8